MREPRNIASREFKADPFPFYARLRSTAPVHRMILPTKEIVWLVTRYDDAAAILKDDRFVKDPANAMAGEQLSRQRWFRKVFKSLQRNMLNVDAPDHGRLRALVSKAFTPPLIEQMRQRVERLTGELMDAVQGGGRMDVIRDYATPLPTTIIAEMLGVPVADREKFRRWSNATMSASYSSFQMARAVWNAWALLRYLRKIIKQRRAAPRDDLISALLRVEESGDRLAPNELLAMTLLLLLAGFETTVNLIGNGVLTLLEHPDQLEKLRNDPSLIKPAVEEMLRFAGPIDTSTERYASQDITIAGVTIPRGEMVMAAIASANRDERRFPNPDSFDITRDPNKHLSFGAGTHFCLGAALARLEAQIAINTLLRRAPELRLAIAPARLRWKPGLILRGLESLPVIFENATVGLKASSVESVLKREGIASA